MRGPIVVMLSAAVTALSAFHLLFALTNFGLATEEEEAMSVPLIEGVLSLLAAIGLAAAAVVLFKRGVLGASVVALVATAPLPIFFAFTVPKHSDWLFLFASLVVPLLSGATVLGTRRLRGHRGQA